MFQIHLIPISNLLYLVYPLSNFQLKSLNFLSFTISPFHLPPLFLPTTPSASPLLLPQLANLDLHNFDLLQVAFDLVPLVGGDVEILVEQVLVLNQQSLVLLLKFGRLGEDLALQELLLVKEIVFLRGRLKFFGLDFVSRRKYHVV